MPIYSANKSAVLTKVPANESYTCEDIGRILYETQVNDMAFFEAILRCDFNEIKSLNEGTLLESEVAALNEATFKEIVNKLCDRLKKFWAKIKAVFKDAIEKIQAYALNDGKAFIKQFKKTVMYKIGTISRWTGSI